MLRDKQLLLCWVGLTWSAPDPLCHLCSEQFWFHFSLLVDSLKDWRNRELLNSYCKKTLHGSPYILIIVDVERKENSTCVCECVIPSFPLLIWSFFWLFFSTPLLQLTFLQGNIPQTNILLVYCLNMWVLTVSAGRTSWSQPASLHDSISPRAQLVVSWRLCTSWKQM